MIPALAHGMAPDAWTDFWRPFLFSPGAAAAAALIAAVVAFLAAGRTADASRKTAREDQRQRDEAARREKWWAATMWAADHSLSPHSQEAALGFRALEALQAPGVWGIEDRQVAFIRALTEHVLDEIGMAANQSLAGRASAQSRTGMNGMRQPLTYEPAVYAAAARTRVTSNTLLNLPSAAKLLRLASGDTTVLDERDSPADDPPEIPRQE